LEPATNTGLVVQVDPLNTLISFVRDPATQLVAVTHAID
jgi:hypothetical protein